MHWITDNLSMDWVICDKVFITVYCTLYKHTQNYAPALFCDISFGASVRFFVQLSIFCFHKALQYMFRILDVQVCPTLTFFFFKGGALPTCALLAQSSSHLHVYDIKWANNINVIWNKYPTFLNVQNIFSVN